MRTPRLAAIARVQPRVLLLVRTLICISGLACSSAQAQFGVNVQPGITCLQQEQLENALEPGIAGALEHESLTITVQGSSEDPRTATIRMTREDEPVAERTFSPGPPRCPDFHAAIAVTIAIMLRSVESPSAAAPAPVSVPIPIPIPPLVPRRLPPPRERIPLALSPRASALLGWGVEASRQRGFSAELELASRRWAVRAGVLALFSVDQRFSQVEAGYATRPLAGSVDGCVRLLRARHAHSDLCAGLLLGRLQARGLAGPDSLRLGSDSYRWVGLRAQLDLAIRLASPLFLVASLSAIRGLVPITLTADDGVGDNPRDQKSLARTGVLLGLGFAYDFQRQGSTNREHQ